MKRKKRMQKYIIMFLVASMLLSVGCGETKPEEPVNVIGFGEMDTDGVASWRPEENSNNAVDVNDSISVKDESDEAENEIEITDTNAENTTEDATSDGQQEEKEGLLLSMEPGVLDNPLFASFLANETVAVDNTVRNDATIVSYLDFDFYGEEFYLEDLYEAFQEKTLNNGGIQGVQIFTRDFDLDEKEELVVLIEYWQNNGLAGVLYTFKEKNGTLYAWEESFVFAGNSKVTFYENGTFSKAYADSTLFTRYDEKGQLEPILSHYEYIPRFDSYWGSVECSRGVTVYENGAEAESAEYEFRLWSVGGEEQIEKEEIASQKEYYEIMNAFWEEQGGDEGLALCTLSNLNRAEEFAERVSFYYLCSYSSQYPVPTPKLCYTDYQVDEEVESNDLFMQFINGETEAYELVEVREDVKDFYIGEIPETDEESTVISSFEKPVMITDVYEEHKQKYNIYYIDASWYEMDAVRFAARDLDGDDKEELLMLVEYGEKKGDLHVFHEENGKLYRWESLRDIRDSVEALELCFYKDNVIGIVGKEDAEYLRYNEAGAVEKILSIDFEYKDRQDYETMRIYYRTYKAVFYENGVQTDVLYYEDKYFIEDIDGLPSDADEYRSTSDGFVKDRYQKEVSKFKEELGDCEALLGAKETHSAEKLYTVEVVELFRTAECESRELLDYFREGKIPAQYVSYENGIPEITGRQGFLIELYHTANPEIGRLANLDADSDYEMVVRGPYGGTYLDARNGKVYIIATGQGTANVISYAEYDEQNWIMESDTTHGGRQWYHLRRLDSDGTIIEEFTLAKYYWDNPGEPDGPDTVYEYNGEEITKFEYDRILGSLDIVKTSAWYYE